MQKLKFRIVKSHANARVGELTLRGITVQTPIFMPVGTKGTIKGILLELLQDPYRIGSDNPPIPIILSNTFHLYLRPGIDVIKKIGGLHTFIHWPNLILTDSGGFQVFSLGLARTKHTKKNGGFSIKYTTQGVEFVSPYDGSKHYFSPEKVVDIQIGLQSDIMMMLDICSPAGLDKKQIQEQMLLTHHRAERAFIYYTKYYNHSHSVLFPIVQGGCYLDLRQQSITYLQSFATDGIAVGGVSVGEEKEKMYEVIQYTGSRLPIDKPRYLMGVGTPEDIMYAVQSGFDMFDCVQATRLGRHGVLFSDYGNIHITNSIFKSDPTPFSTLSPGLSQYSRAYIHHLFKEKEMLGGILLSLHNIIYLHTMLTRWKKTLL